MKIESRLTNKETDCLFTLPFNKWLESIEWFRKENQTFNVAGCLVLNCFIFHSLDWSLATMAVYCWPAIKRMVFNLSGCFWKVASNFKSLSTPLNLTYCIYFCPTKLGFRLARSGASWGFLGPSSKPKWTWHFSRGGRKSFLTALPTCWQRFYQVDVTKPIFSQKMTFMDYIKNALMVHLHNGV